MGIPTIREDQTRRRSNFVQFSFNLKTTPVLQPNKEDSICMLSPLMVANRFQICSMTNVVIHHQAPKLITLATSKVYFRNCVLMKSNIL